MHLKNPMLAPKFNYANINFDDGKCLTCLHGRYAPIVKDNCSLRYSIDSYLTSLVLCITLPLKNHAARFCTFSKVILSVVNE